MIRREGQDDFWLNIGLVFPHKDNGGFNIMLQAFPLDGKIVCREIAEGEEPTKNVVNKFLLGHNILMFSSSKKNNSPAWQVGLVHMLTGGVIYPFLIFWGLSFGIWNMEYEYGDSHHIFP